MAGAARRVSRGVSRPFGLLLAGAAMVSAPAGAQAPAASPAPPAASAAPALSPANAPSSFGHYRPPPTFAEQHKESLYVRMRDGVRLAVTVARPARDGKPVEGRFPVIWHHSLSATQEEADGTGPRAGGFRAIPSLTEYGYVVVQVARRGNGQSFGTRRGYHDRNEAHDAYEMIDWLAAQPWSNGDVAMYGCSNTGDATLQAMTTGNPHLKAVFAGCFTWDKYDGMRRGGIFAQWGTGPSRTIEQDMTVAPVAGDEDKRLLRQAAEEHQRATPLIDVWKSMPYRNSWAPTVQSAFWAEGSSASYLAQLRRAAVPLYIVGGWRDEFRDQGLIAFLNLPGTRIIIGDWLHCQNEGFALAEEAHRFFDRHLKNIDTGIDRDPRIHYFTLGAQEWRSATSWPIADARPLTLSLTARGLEERPVNRDYAQSFAVDYSVSCPEGGSGSTVQPCHLPGQGLSLAGPPLKAPMELTGHGLADIWIAADAPDANLFLLVEDVAPDGAVRVVTEGRLKASLRKEHPAPWTMPAGVPWHRAYAEDAQPLVPGEPVRLRFDILPTSWVFKAGHRIQFTLTGSDHRERARDPAAQPTRITLVSDRKRPSTVTLPIAPAR